MLVYGAGKTPRKYERRIRPPTTKRDTLDVCPLQHSSPVREPPQQQSAVHPTPSAARQLVQRRGEFSMVESDAAARQPGAGLAQPGADTVAHMGNAGAMGDVRRPLVSALALDI